MELTNTIDIDQLWKDIQKEQCVYTTNLITKKQFFKLSRRL